MQTRQRRARSIERHTQIDSGELTCTKCGVTKPLSDFTPVPRIRYASWCKGCTAVASLRRHREDPAASRNSQLRRAYGITLDEYNAMVEAHGGVCAICGEAETRRNRHGTDKMSLCVDHDHATGAVRGLLCHRCNVAVGFIERHTELLDRVAEYLQIGVRSG